MDWLITVSLVIVFIVIGLIFFIFMPKPKVFFDPYTNTTLNFTQEFNELEKEIMENNLADNPNIPVIPIYGNGTIRSDRYPKLYELLRSMPYVRYAGIINLKKMFEQTPEYGFDEVANNTIRYFYTIKAPAANKSGIWIDGEKRFFAQKEWICGDMSREHSLFNKNKYDTCTVIFIDIDRHDSIHLGCSPNKEIKKDEILKVFFMQEMSLTDDGVSIEFEDKQEMSLTNNSVETD